MGINIATQSLRGIMLDHLALGRPVKSYQRNAPGSRKPLLTNSMALLSIALTFCVGMYRGVYGYFNFGIVAAYSWSRNWFLATLLIIAIFVLILIFRHIRSNSYIYIYEKGMQLSRYRQEPIALLWKDIHSIYEDSHQSTFLWVPVQTRYSARIVALNGQVIDIRGEFENLDDLIQRIKAKSYPRLKKAAITRFQNKEAVSFGPITISQDDVKTVDYHLLWSQIKDIQLNEGKLMIELMGKKKISVLVKHIPNVEILIQILMDGIRY
jgi:hypothetical protein